MYARLSLLIFLGPWFAWNQASASLTFEPTADEWATWPPFCRARYASLAFQIQGTELTGQISAPEIEQWRNALGSTFEHVHHYCFALGDYRRAMSEIDNQKRVFRLNDALGDAKYTYDRIKITDPLGPEIAALYAQIEFELGRADHARTLLNNAMNEKPDADRPYLVLSSIERKAGNLPNAIAVLEKGNSMTNEKSAEINYALGLMYVEQRNYPAAQACATRAYDLGYPLPGLKHKLQRLGQ